MSNLPPRRLPGEALPGQATYDKDDERRLRQEIQEREAQRQKSYSKDDERTLQAEINHESGDDESGDEEK